MLEKKLYYSLLRLTSFVLDMLVPVGIVCLCSILFGLSPSKYEEFWALVVLYIFFSSFWVIGLSILQKKKLNLGYRITHLWIKDFSLGDSPRVSKLILRNGFLILVYGPLIALDIFGIIAVVSILIMYFFTKSNRALWDLFANTVVVWDNRLYIVNDKTYLMVYPKQHDKFIRFLKVGEVIKWIKQGKVETVKNRETNWVKVKTDQGEVGWCYNIYLEKTER